MIVLRKIFLPLISLLVSIIGLIVLVSLGAVLATPLYVVSFVIFGSGLIVLYAFYTAFSILRGTEKESGVRKLHNIGSYILISATYTPIYLAVFPSGWGWSMFGVSWALTLLGIFLYCFKNISQKVHTIIYILVDWIIVVAFYPLYSNLPFIAVKVLTLGSALYTMAVIMDKRGHFYLAQINMLLGSLVHIWFMLEYVIA